MNVSLFANSPVYCESPWTNICLRRNELYYLKVLPQSYDTNTVMFQREFLACITTTFHLTWLYTIDCILHGHRYGILLDMMVNVFPSFVILFSVLLQPSPDFIEYVRILNQLMSVLLLWGIAKTALCVMANVYSFNTRQVKTGHSNKLMTILFLGVVPILTTIIQKYKSFHFKYIGVGFLLALKFKYPFEELPDALQYGFLSVLNLFKNAIQSATCFIHGIKKRSMGKFRETQISRNKDKSSSQSKLSSAQNTQNAASHISLDIIYTILQPEYQSTLKDVTQLRLLNRHWAYATAKQVMSKMTIPLQNLSTPHIQNCFQDNGYHVVNLNLTGVYEKFYDDDIMGLLSYTPNLKRLCIKNMYSNALMLKIGNQCPRLQHLDFGVGSTMLEKIHLNPMIRWISYTLRNARRVGNYDTDKIISPVTPIDAQFSALSLFFDIDLQLFKHLKSVNLSGYLHSGRQLCESMASQQQTLTNLYLSNCPKLSQISKVIEFFSNLQVLDLSYSRIETLEMAFIFQILFTRRSKIHTLNLANVKPDVARALTIFGVQLLPGLRRMDPASFMNYVPSLRKLNVANAKGIRFEELVALMAAFPGLQSLHMRGCRKVNLQAFVWLIDTCDHLESLDLTDCHPALNDPEFTCMSLAVCPPPISYSLLVEGKREMGTFRTKLAALINSIQIEQMAGGALEAQLRILRVLILVLLLFTLATLIYALILFVKY